jgi:AraC-like DNA-binding protein
MISREYFERSSQFSEHFPYIAGMKKIRHKANLHAERQDIEISFLTFIYIQEGRFVCEVNQKSMILLTRDLLFLKPGDIFSNKESRLEQGTFLILSLEGNCLEEFISKYSRLEISDRQLIHQLFDFNNPVVVQGFQAGGEIYDCLFEELEQREVGFKTRVISLIDDLIVLSSRSLTHQEMNPHDFPKAFSKLDKLLRENLSHPWTVNEMAGVVGLKVTSFTEKIKFFTGFAPLQYLINLRVAEAMRLIRNTNHSLTKIALETGFYSSQHFSSTFKKMTGFSPKNFRENV